MLYKISVLHIFQNSLENTCLETLFNKVAGIRAATLLRRDSITRMFLRILRKFNKTFLQNTSGWPPEHLYLLFLPVITCNFDRQFIYLSKIFHLRKSSERHHSSDYENCSRLSLKSKRPLKLWQRQLKTWRNTFLPRKSYPKQV